MSYPEHVSRVPEGWEARPLKYSVSLRNEKVDAKSTDLDYMGLEHIESWTGKRLEDESAASEGTAMEGNEEIFGKLMTDGEFRKLAQEDLMHRVYRSLKNRTPR